MATYLNNFQHLEIQLEEIISATKNFDDSRVIGCGGFGKVYKGELSHPDGKIEVAFKRLDRKYGQGDPEFFKEIRMLSCYRHKNLIPLLGFCKEGDEMILVYEYVSRGSLDRLLKSPDLTWSHRLKICLDAAKGLSFLHDPNGTQQRVLHCDIKSANILLDESLNAKVADFGLSKISPANQQHTFLVTSPAGTHGYCDPLYMDTYQLTKESDVYSFGVVLFEVLCGRVCYENSNGKLKVFVHHWKKCYQEKKLDEIIFPDLNHQMEPKSFETFVDIAYQCLERSREQRPTMSVVVEKLEAALELQEQEQIRKATEQEYKDILKSADPPLEFLEFPVNGGKTLLSINDKGEVICERVCIEACLDQIQYDRLQDPSGFENLRFSGGRCYCKDENELNVCVRAGFLYPQITYSVNLVFTNDGTNMCKTLRYKLNGEAKCFIVYNTYKREDGWFVVPLYQFTSNNKIANFKINFEGLRKGCKLQVAGFEFQHLDVEPHDQGLEEYKDIVKAASQTLFYKSLDELKELLSIGFHINNHKTWFSLNENGEHCEMLSIAHCLISPGGGNRFYDTDDLYSRFPHFYRTNQEQFRVHIRTQFLTPSIRYTVNLVLRKGNSYGEQVYVFLRYKLEGTAKTSIVYLANKTKDNRSFIAELYQFTSNGTTFDLKMVFQDHKDDLEIEGILFQPLEKLEHEQVLEDEEWLDDSLQWTIKKDLFSFLLKRFNGQEGSAVDNNGKKSLMFSARGIIQSRDLSFESSDESRFGEVAVITNYYGFSIIKEIKSDGLSPETTYAIYLIYKLPQDQSEFNGLLEITNYKDLDLEYRYIYLVSPKPQLLAKSLIKTLTTLHIHTNYMPFHDRGADGWMELKVSPLQTLSYSGTIDMGIFLRTPDYSYISGLIIESIELRPIVVHSA